MLIALDWFILVVLLGGLVRGYMVGAVRQIGSLVGLAVALLMSVEFMEPVGERVVSSLGLSESLMPLAGFAVVFLGVYFLILLLSGLVEHLLDSLSLSVANRAVGGAVGGIKAALLLSLLFLALGGMRVPDQQTRDASAFYTPIAQLLPRALEATEDWIPAAQNAADKLERQVRSTLEANPEAPESPESVGWSSDDS
jgi:membrane protein required for colicin V production